MEKTSLMKIIIGLGNIGQEYEGTRHNVGFEFVEYLKNEWNGTDWKEQKKCRAFISEIQPEVQKDGEKILLAKPTTYMNLSGEAIMSLHQYYKIPFENMLIVYDDIDLPLGEIRMREKGGPGTHNGMRSIIETIKTENIPRLRIGIENNRGQKDLADYVLAKWTKEEKKIIETALKKSKETISKPIKISDTIL